jgi:hypothetical protein
MVNISADAHLTACSAGCRTGSQRCTLLAAPRLLMETAFNLNSPSPRHQRSHTSNTNVPHLDHLHHLADLLTQNQDTRTQLRCPLNPTC